MNFPDPVLLAQIQFAFTVSFHIIFPGPTIGLASYLAVLEGLWLALFGLSFTGLAASPYPYMIPPGITYT